MSEASTVIAPMVEAYRLWATGRMSASEFGRIADLCIIALDAAQPACPLCHKQESCPPEYHFCSRCHEHAVFEQDEDGDWLSVCCAAQPESVDVEPREEL